jgi:superfamily II DNA or RNA helicase
MSMTYDIDSLSDETREDVIQRLEILPESKYGKKKSFDIYSIEAGNVSIPFYFSYRMRNEKPNRDIKYSTMKLTFSGKLRQEQKEVKKEMLSYLNEFGSCMLSARCGFGKTFFSIYMACKIGMKTCVLTHRVLIADQWVDEFQTHSVNPRIKIARKGEEFSENIDIYIISIILVKKLGKEFMQRFGMVICDEAHILCAENASQCLLYTTPKYLIGLSATPDEKTDGTGIIIDHYFGPHRIFRNLNVSHDVFRLSTHFKPEYTLNFKGKIDWNSVLESQCGSAVRNELILKLCRYFSERNILVLCKRVVQANYLCEKLTAESESVDVFVASKKKPNYESRILVSTYSKSGVGFNHPKLDMLIVASDVEAYIQQYHGRIFRREDSRPIVIDMVDDLPVLKSHWLTRRSYYKKTGGHIKIFRKTYKDFFT